MITDGKALSPSTFILRSSSPTSSENITEPYIECSLLYLFHMMSTMNHI